MKSFKEKVLNIVGEISRGKTMSYAEVSKKAGSPKAFRAVGNIMKANFDKTVPCHRVVCSDGRIGGYNRCGEKAKRKLLKKELALRRI